MHLHPHIARELSEDIGRRRRAEAARASIGVDGKRQVASTGAPARDRVAPRLTWLPWRGRVIDT